MGVKMIYLDNAATTKLHPFVLEEMLPFMNGNYGNPSSLYELATISKNAIEHARQIIADAIEAKPEEIYFTGGGSEADNWAIKAVCDANKHKGNHIITTKIEHHAVLHTCEYMEKHGYEVTYLDVGEQGIVDIKALKKAIRPTTVLISIMFANNEIGTIQPIEQISQVAREHGIYFHTDGVQAFGQIPISVKKQGFDLLSVSAHKFHGPKGVGFLYVRSKVKIQAFIHGGHQERGLRAGTQNVAGIVGMGKAAQIAMDTMKGRVKKERELRDYLIGRVYKEIPYVRLNGHPRFRLPGNANFSFQFIEGEAIVLMLDMEGICVSSGSACTAGLHSPSHVLMALGMPEEIAYGSLRVTLSGESTKEEVDILMIKLKQIVSQLRKKSSAYEMYLGR